MSVSPQNRIYPRLLWEACRWYFGGMTKRRRIRSKAELLGDVPPPKRGRPVEAHRVRLATAQAELAEIRAAKLRAELVPAADVLAEWAAICADVRQRLLAIPSRLGSKLALPRETVAALDAEIRATLEALASQGGADDGNSTRAS